MSALPMRHGGCGSAGAAVSVPTTFWRRSTAGSDSLSTTTILSQRSTRSSRGSTIRLWHFLPRAPNRQESEPLSPHYARTTCCDRRDGRATGQPQALGLARFETRGGPASDCAKPAGAEGRVVCGAKRIRSLYLPFVRERLPGLSTASPPEGRASFSTINGAITPRRDVFAEQTTPALRHPIAAFEVVPLTVGCQGMRRCPPAAG